MDILTEIVAHKRIELEAFKAEKPLSVIAKEVENMLDTKPASMRQALMTSDSGIIAEFKRKSPSKGWIKEEGKAEEIPLSYQQNGAAALSILTDQHYFGGEDEFNKN
jgi:indole-3-glycerol phosphate synthase